MKPRDFLNQTKLNMFARELNSHSGSHTWKSDRTIEINITKFARDVHHVGRDANGENTLVDLRTSTLNASQVQFRRGRGESLKVYALVPSNGSTHGGRRLERQWLVELRDSRGKKHTLRIGRDRDGMLSSNPLNFMFNRHDEESRKRFSEILENWKYGGEEELIKILPEGWRLVTNFEFNLELWMVPKGVKRTSRGVTIAYETNGTYQSLPCLIEIKKQTATKVASLSEHGIETSGYYSHDTHLYIRPEQLKAAKQLASTVKRMAAK